MNEQILTRVQVLSKEYTKKLVVYGQLATNLSYFCERPAESSMRMELKELPVSLNHLQFSLQHHKSALFWADKAASLSQYHISDVYHLVQCMFNCQQYERAALFIVKRSLHLKYCAFRYLASKCYTESKQWQLALDLLEGPAQEGSSIISKHFVQSEKVDSIPDDAEMVSSLHLLKGEIYEAMDIREIATECYKDALKADVFCYEAFERLTEHHMLRAEEEQDLLDSLPMTKQCKSKDEEELLQFLYNTKLKKYNKPGQIVIPESVDSLHENLDIATSLAERHYYNCEFKTSFKITEGILKADPYHTQCLPLHVALLVELKESNKLFYLAHQLVGRYPDLPISWYAVGCYYLLQPKKQELCRRYLLKTTLLDKMYGPAWLAYGHSFASQNEHDQAMAAYFTASQLMKGCHLPFLYIGLEYSVTNNTKLAEKFFSTALEVSPDDPHVLHEMAIAMYTNRNYQGALKYFTQALEQVQILGDETVIEEWEPLMNNMGHTYRKLKDYQRALDCHRRALVLVPHSADTYSAIGLVYSYMGDYDEALEYLHKSLGLRRDDVFTSRLLDTVITRFSECDQAICDPLEPEGAAPSILGAQSYRAAPLKLGTKKPIFVDLQATPDGRGDMTLDEDSRLFGGDTTLDTHVSGVQSIGPDTPGDWAADESTSSGSRTCSTSSTVHREPVGGRGRSYEGLRVVSTDDDIEMGEYTE